MMISYNFLWQLLRNNNNNNTTNNTTNDNNNNNKKSITSKVGGQGRSGLRQVNCFMYEPRNRDNGASDVSALTVHL